jgi:hypothetical protein
MNPKIYSNINNYLIIYTPKVIPWGPRDKQINGRTNKQMDGRTNIYSIFRDKLSLPHGSSDCTPFLSRLWWMIFGVKCENKDDVNHLVASIKTTYTLTEDWSGDLYCGIVLAWDYDNRMVDISMPGYIKKKIQQFKHVQSKRTQTCPYSLAPKQFGIEAQAPLPPNVFPCLNKEGIRCVQCIMGSILYNVCAVDMTVLIAWAQ